nr:PREDICTED: nuclear receptor subfamily 5 group A member 2-like [Latimeria chalumnae]|eukprot:XP_006014291.1 PREDICTED: nuclear receptor subfamily 5 group A member 2-like [Latimeria chalumnae]
MRRSTIGPANSGGSPNSGKQRWNARAKQEDVAEEEDAVIGANADNTKTKTKSKSTKGKTKTGNNTPRRRLKQQEQRETAVRADRMRGGRNKFGPMYKRDRALKQQKKAMVRATGFKIETVPQMVSPVQTDYSLSTIHSIHSASKGIPSNPASVMHADYDRSPYCPPSIGMTVPNHGALAGYQYSSFPNRAIKSEYPDHYTSSPESLAGYSYPDSYQTNTSPNVPQLILEFLQCEPDESQVQAKIVACLQQEQANRGKNEKLSTFGLLCKMADQTLFSIVEWARSCIFFKELKVR